MDVCSQVDNNVMMKKRFQVETSTMVDIIHPEHHRPETKIMSDILIVCNLLSFQKDIQKKILNATFIDLSVRCQTGLSEILRRSQKKMRLGKTHTVLWLNFGFEDFNTHSWVLLLVPVEFVALSIS